MTLRSTWSWLWLFATPNKIVGLRVQRHHHHIRVRHHEAPAAIAEADFPHHETALAGGRVQHATAPAQEGRLQDEWRAVVVQRQWSTHDDVAGARGVLELNALEDIGFAVETEEFLENGKRGVWDPDLILVVVLRSVVAKNGVSEFAEDGIRRRRDDERFEFDG